MEGWNVFVIPLILSFALLIIGLKSKKNWQIIGGGSCLLILLGMILGILFNIKV